jgi:hypothetical protein
MFQTKIVDKIETHILYSITCFENRAVYEIMWKKHGKAGQTKDDNRMQALCMLYKQGYRHTHVV